MSWAAGRSATRTEDVAYSLLGLFDVNMPLLYGEGPKAFQRLQKEILYNSADESIFAWVRSIDGPHTCLAPSPSFFAGCGYLRWQQSITARLPHVVTPHGLQVSTRWTEESPIRLFQHKRNLDVCRLLLTCFEPFPFQYFALYLNLNVIRNSIFPVRASLRPEGRTDDHDERNWREVQDLDYVYLPL